MNIDRLFDDLAFIQRIGNDPDKVADLLRTRVADGERIAQLEAEIKRYKNDHLVQAQRAAELQDEVDRLTEENNKLYFRHNQQKVYLGMKDHTNEMLREVIENLNKKIVRLSDKLEDARKDRDRYRVIMNRRGEAIRRMEEGEL